MTETLTSPSNPAPPLRKVGKFVHRRAASLQNRILRNDPTAVATLARLRRGIGVDPGEHMDLLPITHHDDFVPPDGRDEPSREERAVHAALTFFALHQQSQSRRMHVPGIGLGSALLAAGGPKKPAAQRRFQVLGTSEEFAELTHHLRGVVQLLRQDNRPLDYGRLADELLSWQFPPRGPASVRLRWGRDFYRTPGTAPGGTDTAEIDEETES